jgi:hypothetical protein
MLGRQRRRFILAVLAVVALLLVHQKRESLPAIPGVALHGGRHGHCRSNWGRDKALVAAHSATSGVGILSSENLTELIVVAGHAVFVGHDFDDADEPTDTADWTLLPYQMRQLPAFIDHVRQGVKLAQQRPGALLLFSGGQTRGTAGPRSEAQSYWWLADAHGWFGEPNVRARAYTEEFARDSFENLLFSLCRYRELVGGYPQRLSVISLPFKRQRFETLHRAALRWPAERFEFIGIETAGEHDEAETARVAAAELKNSLEPFRGDPYGCKLGGVLSQKRASRDPTRRVVSCV